MKIMQRWDFQLIFNSFSILLKDYQKRELVELEILLAIEYFVLANGEFAPATSTLFDILYSRAVISASTFGQWSHVDADFPAKAKLVRFLAREGFNLVYLPKQWRSGDFGYVTWFRACQVTLGLCTRLRRFFTLVFFCLEGNWDSRQLDFLNFNKFNSIESVSNDFDNDSISVSQQLHFVKVFWPIKFTSYGRMWSLFFSVLTPFCIAFEITWLGCFLCDFCVVFGSLGGGNRNLFKKVKCSNSSREAERKSAWAKSS